MFGIDTFIRGNFVTDDGGRRLFLPFAASRTGYVLRDPVAEDDLRAFLKWFYASCPPAVGIVLVLGGFIRQPLSLLALPVAFIAYGVAVRRRTRGLDRIEIPGDPHGEFTRFARSLPPGLLRALVALNTVLAVIGLLGMLGVPPIREERTGVTIAVVNAFAVAYWVWLMWIRKR